MNATTLQSSSTLNSNQSTMSCMGNPQAIIRKCVHPSMPHSNFYLLGNRAKIPKCNLQKKCCWFSQHFKSAEFLCKGWQILYVFKLSFTFFMSNLLPQNLGTFFEIYRSATGLILVRRSSMHLHLLFKYELEISPSLTPKQLSYSLPFLHDDWWVGHRTLKIKG